MPQHSFSDQGHIVVLTDEDMQPRLPDYSVEIDEETVPTIDSYIDAACDQGAAKISERMLAAMLGVSRSTVSHWRKRKAWPSDEIMVRLAQHAGERSDEALLHLNYWRARDSFSKRLYLRMMGALRHLIIPALVLAFTWPAHATDREQIGVRAARSIHYAISRLGRRLVGWARRAAAALLAGARHPRVVISSRTESAALAASAAASLVYQRQAEIKWLYWRPRVMP